MSKFHGKSFIIAAALFLFSMPLGATRGPEDYGIILAFFMFCFSFPAGLLLLSLIILSVIRLKSEERPLGKQGTAIFVISLIIFVCSLIIPAAILYLKGCNGRIMEIIAADFVPVLLLAGISAELSRRVMNRRG